MNLLYLRKSSEAEDRQALSLESQESELQALAKKHQIKIDKVFKESRSARTIGRPEFNKLIEFIKAHPGSKLLVWKSDRLARNFRDGGEIISLLQENIIAEILTPFGSHLPQDNVLPLALEFGMSTQFSKTLSQDVRRSLEKKLNNGGYTGKVPFGYLNDPTGLKGEKKVFVDEVRSPYVEKIFRLFATGGYSLKDTAIKMYNDGLRTRSGKKIHPSLLFRMITNPFYTGIMVRCGKHYPGNHTPLVSTELFQDCQRVLTGNRSKKQHLLFPLRGFVSCPLCGCMITASLRRGHQYYHCTDGKSAHKEKNEPREHFRSEVLNKEVALKLKELQFDERQVEIMYKADLEKSKTSNNFLETAKTQILNSQKSLAEKRARTEDVFIDGSLPKNRYEARILDLNNQATDLTNQLKQLERKQQAEGLDTIGQTKKAFLTAIYAEKNFLCGDDSKKRELAEILLSDITVANQKIQSIQFKPAFQRMYLSPKKLDFELWSG